MGPLGWFVLLLIATTVFSSGKKKKEQQKPELLQTSTRTLPSRALLIQPEPDIKPVLAQDDRNKSVLVPSLPPPPRVREKAEEDELYALLREAKESIDRHKESN